MIGVERGERPPPPLFYFSFMSRASKLVSGAIVGTDYAIVYVNGKAYPVPSPTIKRIAGAILNLSDIEFKEDGTLKDMILSGKDAEAYSRALSWFIKGDLSISEELSEGTMAEVIDALLSVFDMIGIDPFLKAVSLTKNASLLAATPK